MEVELRKLENGNLSFIVSGITTSLANSIRRVMLQEVPVMAVDEVEFAANDSVMSDEIIAHRLGQAPLNTPDGYRLPAECDCRRGRCANCSVDLTLEVEGPGVVRASEMKPSDPEVTPVQGDAPIVRLGEGQRLEFTAIARLGFGEEHANWQPAVASYKYMPVIEIDQDARDDWSECVEACPKDILEVEDGELKVTDVAECTMCEACVDACPDAIEVSGDDTTYVFEVESTGAMSPDRIVGKAIEVLKDKCDEFSEKLDRI